MASRLPSSGRVSALTEVQVLARNHTNAAIQVLADVMQDDGSPAAARVSAATALLDRGWGRATQRVELVTPLEQIGDDELQREIATRLRQIVLEGQALEVTEDGTVVEEPGAPPLLRLVGGTLVESEQPAAADDPDLG